MYISIVNMYICSLIYYVFVIIYLFLLYARTHVCKTKCVEPKINATYFIKA